eukprot:1147670-Pelagomonas_calceolata.AAC.10
MLDSPAYLFVFEHLRTYKSVQEEPLSTHAGALLAAASDKAVYSACAFQCFSRCMHLRPSRSEEWMHDVPAG